MMSESKKKLKYIQAFNANSILQKMRDKKKNLIERESNKSDKITKVQERSRF